MTTTTTTTYTHTLDSKRDVVLLALVNSNHFQLHTQTHKPLTQLTNAQ